MESRSLTAGQGLGLRLEVWSPVRSLVGGEAEFEVGGMWE